jgi:2,4-dienoyl-CoA reductase-like NADH-dependent reductase (Old Yellow Enzyme family)
MDRPKYTKVAQLRSVERLREGLGGLPCDETILSTDQGSPASASIDVGGMKIGNRWCIHPMEGWDANRDGSPTELTLRRWQRFGESGAKLIWGGEAAAVTPRGRANPNQTLGTAANEAGLRSLLDTLLVEHAKFDTTDDLCVGLQLTHSGRFCKPNDHKRWEPRIAYHHPILDSKFGIAADDDSVVITDDELEQLIDLYVESSKLAQRLGFHFVDIKACHGYLLHELLSARTRPGKFGGDLAGRSRVLRTAISRVREECPGLLIGVRLSLFDMLPFQKGEPTGEPAPWDGQYDHGFGVGQGEQADFDLREPIELVRQLVDCGVDMLNFTCGSPYYNPHIQRPAIFPPSDGYYPPEDPLVGVARQIRACAKMKEVFPNLPVVGSGYTYLQEYLPQVAQAVIRERMVDFVGLGRMVLSHPTLPREAMNGRPPVRKLVCRTFSDCTTAPRNGMVSGCYPLDSFYKERPEREAVQKIKESKPTG